MSSEGVWSRLQYAIDTEQTRMRVFDWDQAARIILEEQPREVSAGLGLDWSWTGGRIFAWSRPVFNDYTYLSSCWATPEIDVDGHVFPCWIWQDLTEWDESTKWPDSALQILGVYRNN